MGNRTGSHYNLVAGRSVERIAALSDGIFAVAMTLLVLDLKLPGSEAIRTESQLAAALLGLLPAVVMFLLSFLTLGIFWVGQQTQLSHLRESNRTLAWTHLLFLAAVTLMPFSTRLLAEHALLRTALAVYWCNILLLGLALYASWGFATRAELLKPDLEPAAIAAVCRRIRVAQLLYALGMLLGLADPRWGIGFIVLVQLQFALGLRWPRLA